jgi:hypothetical protein
LKARQPGVRDTRAALLVEVGEKGASKTHEANARNARAVLQVEVGESGTLEASEVFIREIALT